jgi:DNA-binding transcriptional LysR family regulator
MDLDDRASRRIKLRDLRLLLAVSRWGSMAQAAAHLGVSQPAVSKAVADLEDTLGVRLLDRTARGVEPTPYGDALLKRSAAMFDELRQGVKDIEFLADPSAGELRIGASYPVVEMLSLVIERVAARHPKMVFRVNVGDSTELQRGDLTERRLELVFGRVPASAEETMESTTLFDDQVVVAAGTNSPWARRRKLTLAELIDERWFLPPESGLAGQAVVAAFAANALQIPRAAVISNSTHLRNLLLATGRYLAVAPDSDLRVSARHLPFKILPVDLGVAPRPVGIVWLKNRTLGPAARIFIDEARVLARQVR